MNYGQGSTASAIPQPAPAIPGAINSLGGATDRLHDRLDALTQRLDPVLSPLPPASVGEQAGKNARHSLALQIDSEAAKVQAGVDRLEALLNRLEL